MNDDGVVDIRDYAIWRQQFGATNSGNPADLIGDCIVEIRDYGIWQQNFGHIVPPLTPTPGLPGRAYVVNHGTGDVSVIDTTTNTVVGDPIRGLDGDPFAVGVDPTLHRAFVANNGSNNVTVIDTTTNFVGGPIPVGNRPAAVGVDPTVHRAYVANSLGNTVSVIDTMTDFVGVPIPVGNVPVAVGIGP
jgi:YVTN family beta-propeller protein